MEQRDARRQLLTGGYRYSSKWNFQRQPADKSGLTDVHTRYTHARISCSYNRPGQTRSQRRTNPRCRCSKYFSSHLHGWPNATWVEIFDREVLRRIDLSPSHFPPVFVSFHRPRQVGKRLYHAERVARIDNARQCRIYLSRVARAVPNIFLIVAPTKEEREGGATVTGTTTRYVSMFWSARSAVSFVDGNWQCHGSNDVATVYIPATRGSRHESW